MINDKELDNLHEEVVNAKHKLKDSVFTSLFSQKEYLMKLYQALHPEEVSVTEDELTDITIRYVFTDGIYNDLGFKVGDRLIILVEAQSTWSPNIVFRCLMYLAVTYQKYVSDTRQNIYSQKKIHLPKPELYVIYTGNRKADTYISLSEEFFHGVQEFLEVKVKVFYEPDKDDIISQYITFSKVYDQQRSLYGPTLLAVKETIRICKDRDVLRKYLEEHEKEVLNMLFDFGNAEEIERQYHESVIAEMKEKVKQAKEEADKQAKEQVDKQVKEQVDKQVKEQVDKQTKEQIKATIIRMLKQPGFTVQIIAQCVDVPVEEVEKIKKEISLK